eukprot:148863_1
MSQHLACSLSSQSKKDKELLTFGYIRINCVDLIPVDIIKLCKSLYDESLVWNIHSMQLSAFVKATIGNNTAKYTDQWFYCQGIKMRWILDPNPALYSDYNAKVVALRLQISGVNISQLKLYISIYCPQNGASFKRVIDKTHFSYCNSYLISTSFGMILDYQKFDEINFSHYIDVLSFVESENNIKYFKQISMKKQCTFTWNIYGLLLDQMKNACCQQMFYSELFDIINNNWSLCLYPMGQKLNAQKQHRIISVVLRLFKLVSNITSLKVKLIISNSYNNELQQKELEFDSTCKYDDLLCDMRIDLFPSDDLLKLDAISITAKIEVIEVNGDINGVNWARFGIT